MPPRPLRAAAAVAVLLAAVLALTCRPTALPTAAFDLVAELPYADVESEAERIDFSDPAQRRFLEGFSRNERDPGRGRYFAWAGGGGSAVTFHLLAPRDVQLELEGRPYRFPAAPAQAVRVAVNGRALAEIELEPRLMTYTLGVPAVRLRTGRNRLELRYRYSRSPRLDGIADDRRPLAVAWYAIGFGLAKVPEPTTDTQSSELFLPYGSEVSYYLPLPPGSFFQADAWSFRGSPARESTSGRLEITLSGDSADEERVATVTRATAPGPLSLPGRGERLVRLTLRSLSADGPGGVVLTKPVIRLPPSPASPPGAPPARVAPTPAELPNIVLYLADTLRADHLGCYGYGRPVSPRIDAFARRAVVFDNALAQSSWTRASVASILTGRWPRAHGANRRDDALPEDALTLPELLKKAGYRTAAFVTNPNVTAPFGFSQGFDDFSDLGGRTDAEGARRAAQDWLDARPGGEPFFLYVHVVDPHAPYESPEPVRRRFAAGSSAADAAGSLDLLDDLQAGRRPLTPSTVPGLLDLYDASIAWNDHSFGSLIDDLEARGLFDRALILFMSDHGEEFHEHGNWQHGRSLHRESLEVPLILKLPRGSAGRRIRRPVQHADVLPTVLELAGAIPPPGLEGRSLLPLLGSPRASTPEPIFSYLHLDGPIILSVRQGEWKLIQRYENGSFVYPQLYRPGDDPGERENLAEAFPVRAGYLRTLLRRKLAEDRPAATAAAIDDELRRRLEALGYLGD